MTGGVDANAWPIAAGLDGAGAPVAAGTSNMSGGIKGYLGGVSASGDDAWRSVLSGEFTDPGCSEFGAIAVNSGGSLPAGGWTQAAEPSKESWDSIPSAFVVRHSPAWPVAPPLDSVSTGSATSEDKCTAVAISARGMYAVGHESSGTGDTDAVLLEFWQARRRSRQRTWFGFRCAHQSFTGISPVRASGQTAGSNLQQSKCSVFGAWSWMARRGTARARS